MMFCNHQPDPLDGYREVLQGKHGENWLEEIRTKPIKFPSKKMSKELYMKFLTYLSLVWGG